MSPRWRRFEFVDLADPLAVDLADGQVVWVWWSGLAEPVPSIVRVTRGYVTWLTACGFSRFSDPTLRWMAMERPAPPDLKKGQ